MYDNEYEWDILLFLRILKYLHTSDADMLNAIIRDYPAAIQKTFSIEKFSEVFAGIARQ